jgi:hypothetical protein
MMEAARTSETSVHFYHRLHGATTQKTALIALMMEAARTSETLVNFYQTARHYNPEDSHLRQKTLFAYRGFPLSKTQSSTEDCFDTLD